MVNKILGEEKGSVMIMVVIALLVLIGFTGLVIDGGQAYLTKSRLQNAADAAALAGAQELPTSETAAEMAVLYAGKNGMAPSWSDRSVSGNAYTATRADDLVVAQILPASEGETITQLKYTEADLNKLREEFQAQLNAMGNAELMALADSYPIIYETMQQTTGYTYAELDGMTPAALIALANLYSVTDGLTITTTPGTHTAGDYSSNSNKQLLEEAKSHSVTDGLITLLIVDMSEPQLRECAADYGYTIPGSCLNKDGKIKNTEKISGGKNKLEGYLWYRPGVYC